MIDRYAYESHFTYCPETGNIVAIALPVRFAFLRNLTRRGRFKTQVFLRNGAISCKISSPISPRCPPADRNIALAGLAKRPFSSNACGRQNAPQYCRLLDRFR